MIQRLRNRIARSEAQGGFTLIELLVVIIIIGILLAVAVPSYLGFRDRANDSRAQSNIRAAVPAVEAYFSDNSGAAGDADNSNTTSGYEGMNLTELRQIDAAVSSDLDFASLTTSSYCLDDDSVSGSEYKKAGPSATITSGSC